MASATPLSVGLAPRVLGLAAPHRGWTTSFRPSGAFMGPQMANFRSLAKRADIPGLCRCKKSQPLSEAQGISRSSVGRGASLDQVSERSEGSVFSCTLNNIEGTSGCNCPGRLARRGLGRV